MKIFPMQTEAKKQKEDRLSMRNHRTTKRKKKKEEEMQKHLEQIKKETEAEVDTVWLELTDWLEYVDEFIQENGQRVSIY